MTLAQALASRLETENFGVVGQSIHLSKLPSNVTDPTDHWLVETAGGTIPESGSLGRKYRVHHLVLHHWQDTAADLHAADESLQSALAGTLPLGSYTVARHFTHPMEDQPDEDHPDTYHGVWHIHITTLKEA